MVVHCTKRESDFHKQKLHHENASNSKTNKCCFVSTNKLMKKLCFYILCRFCSKSRLRQGKTFSTRLQKTGLKPGFDSKIWLCVNFGKNSTRCQLLKKNFTRHQIVNQAFTTYPAIESKFYKILRINMHCKNHVLIPFTP